MTIQDAQYAAAFLRFSAMPAGAFELMGTERQQAIETWLLKKLPRLVRGFLVLLVLLYATMFLLVKAGPYVILGGLVLSRPIGTFLMAGTNPEDSGPVVFVVIMISIAAFILAALQTWVIPVGWLLYISHPLEWVSDAANEHWFTDWLIPDYSSRALLEFYQSAFENARNWLWSSLAVAYRPYFFVARGGMLAAILAIQLSFVVGSLIGGFLVFGIPLFLFIRASAFLKRVFRIPDTEGVIPVGGFALLAAGECLGFAIETLCRFTDVMCRP